MLNRRNFLRSLPFLPSAMRAAAVAITAPKPKPAQMMIRPYIQRRRIVRYVSPAYEEALRSTLTHASIQAITPGMLEAMAKKEDEALHA